MPREFRGLVLDLAGLVWKINSGVKVYIRGGNRELQVNFRLRTPILPPIWKRR
jgi:hypothetical protein